MGKYSRIGGGGVRMMMVGGSGDIGGGGCISLVEAVDRGIPVMVLLLGFCGLEIGQQ